LCFEDIELNRARLSRSPAKAVWIPPKRFQRRDNAATLAKKSYGGLFPNIAGTARAQRDGDRQKNEAQWIAVASRAT
jgi:hypothetical protein